MRKIAEWISGWIETIRIMVFYRETYRLLRQPFDPADFTEVGPPC